MAAITDYLETRLLDHTLRGDPFTSPTELFVSLHTAATTDAGGGTEVSGGAYARAQINTQQPAANWTAASDQITVTGHGYRDNTGPVRLSTTGTLPTGLSAATDYFIRVVDANTIQLSLTSGGAAVDFTDSGTGSHRIQHMTPAASPGGTTDNRGTIDWPNASGANWGTVTHLAVWDAKTSGNMLWHGALTASRVVNDGDRIQVPVADLDISLA